MRDLRDVFRDIEAHENRAKMDADEKARLKKEQDAQLFKKAETQGAAFVALAKELEDIPARAGHKFYTGDYPRDGKLRVWVNFTITEHDAQSESDQVEVTFDGKAKPVLEYTKHKNRDTGLSGNDVYEQLVHWAMNVARGWRPNILTAIEKFQEEWAAKEISGVSVEQKSVPESPGTDRHSRGLMLG